MLNILLPALQTFAGFLFRSIIVKFFLYFALFFVIKEFIDVLLPMFPGAGILTSALGGLTPSVWFFLDLFKFDVGINVCLAAFVTRFIIRRVPLLG